MLQAQIILQKHKLHGLKVKAEKNTQHFAWFKKAKVQGEPITGAHCFNLRLFNCDNSLWGSELQNFISLMFCSDRFCRDPASELHRKEKCLRVDSLSASACLPSQTQAYSGNKIRTLWCHKGGLWQVSRVIDRTPRPGICSTVLIFFQTCAGSNKTSCLAGH